MDQIIFLLIMYIPVWIFVSAAIIDGNINVLSSSLMLVTMALMGISMLALFYAWIQYGLIAPAFISFVGFIVVVWFYLLYKGKEKQIILTIKEEVKDGNYKLTNNDLIHIATNDYPRIINILKSKGLVSHKVTYTEVQPVEPIHKF